MSKIEMKIIPKPKEGTRTIFATESIRDDFVFFSGNGEHDYICSQCRRIICKKIDRGAIKNIVFICPKCKSYLELKGA